MLHRYFAQSPYCCIQPVYERPLPTNRDLLLLRAAVLKAAWFSSGRSRVKEADAAIASRPQQRCDGELLVYFGQLISGIVADDERVKAWQERETDLFRDPARRVFEIGTSRDAGVPFANLPEKKRSRFW